MALTKGFARNAATTPLDARLMHMAGIVCNVDGSPRVGVLGGANVSIVATTATMNVTIAAAEFVTSKGKSDGVMTFTNDGLVNLLISAAPASNSRIDVIWVKHEDNTTGDAASLPIFGVTAGTAAATPTKPAIPTGALELATMLINAGTIATNGGANVLTNTYQMTAARGGVVHFRTKADLNLWTTAVDGQPARAAGDSYTLNAAAWLFTGQDSVSILSPDGNAIINTGYLEKSDAGWVDLMAQAQRTNATTYATALIIGILPIGFRPAFDIVVPVITYGSGSANSAVIATTGTITLIAGSPAGHTIARVQARFRVA